MESFLDKAVDLGFPAVALVAKRPHVSPHDYDDPARQVLRKRLKERNLELAALMGYTDFTAGMNRAGVPSAEMNAAYVEVLAKLAADLGTTRLRILTAGEHPDVPYELQYAELVKGLRLAARVAARYEVTLLLQPYHDIAVHHKQFVWLLKEVNEPNLKAAFDAWGPFLHGLSGEELAEAVQQVGPWIGWTTVADYVRHPRFRYERRFTNYQRSDPDVVRAARCGTGEVDYASFFAGLKAAGYRGYVAYEMCEVLEGGGSIENLDRTARAFLEFLEKFQD